MSNLRTRFTSLRALGVLALLAFTALPTFASEASLALPALEVRQPISFDIFGSLMSGHRILEIGLVICALGLIFGAFQYRHLKGLPAHKSMLDVSEMIYGTCRTYLMQQAKLLIALLVLIGIVMAFYFGKLSQPACTGKEVALILFWAFVGMAGSFSVAWFGIRINNIANSRMAFAALRGDPMPLHEIPTRSGMSIGVCLVSIELIMMTIVLMYVPPALAGFCFIGFAIGESLGAAVLRVCGGIFTKIADVGSDMMKIVFKIKEDDARNPGVIADCAGDNAGDSVGPTADGFETYGVTGVALISFILLAVAPISAENAWKLIVWIFTMRIAMVVISILSWKINSFLVPSMAGAKSGKKFNFEHPLTSLVWVTSLLCIAATFVLSHSMLKADFGDLWWKLSVIISCGTIAGAVIPELTRIFTSMHSAHCKEVVNATKEGGTGLTILSGIVAGNFSAFWKGLTILGLMLIAYLASRGISADLMIYPAVFAFGLVAFGMLGMGPVTIAVDSYGPVTDNAQSVFELSTIEALPNASAEIEKQFGFKPDFAKGKEYLEENDGCGNTFKATAKPMLIGTAVVGATTMIFSLVLLLKKELGWASLEPLSIVDPWVVLGLLAGGAVVYWFCGASMQAVTTGAYRAVDYIKKNIKLDGTTKASQKDSNEVVRICTKYAQAGMINIFVVVFALALAFAFVNPQMFAAYLISIALFGLFAAIYMANAGGCWDNAKKVVEVELKQKGTPLHDSTVVGDLVGDPFKDTSSVALNPIIKFTTLFGILAAEIAISHSFAPYKHKIAVVFLVIGLAFVLRSFYGMRIASGSK
ncbi:MAG: sodium-translocating pyrophosphatase [Verrucomicrobiae bacterium]|nr:sodium-translocating pyrophosphatase [Verrucomicrobiae bacterium]